MWRDFVYTLFLQIGNNKKIPRLCIKLYEFHLTNTLQLKCRCKLQYPHINKFLICRSSVFFSTFCRSIHIQHIYILHYVRIHIYVDDIIQFDHFLSKHVLLNHLMLTIACIRIHHEYKSLNLRYIAM